MKVKFGMMMTDGRGKLGGQVASKNRAGSYVRTKVTPSNPQTASQSAVRQNLAVYSKRWSGDLTESQREAWNESANSGLWNKSNIFGDSVRPTGKNLFTGMNLLQDRVNAPALQAPPSKVSFATMRLTTVSAAYGEGIEQIVLGADVDGSPMTATHFLVEATAPLSPGISNAGSRYRALPLIEAVSSGTNTLALTDVYNDVFGSIAGAVGQKIFFRVSQILNGQRVPYLNASVIIEEQA